MVGSQKCHMIQIIHDGRVIDKSEIYMCRSPCNCTDGFISCDPHTGCRREITDPQLDHRFLWHKKNIGRL